MNTWSGMTFTNIARAGLRAFNKKLAPLKGFTLDLSSEVKQQGTAVATRVVAVSGAAVSLSTATGSGGGGGDRSHANVVEDITTTAVTVTLNQDPIKGFHLTDEEAMQIGSGVWEDTKSKLITQKAYAVANHVLNYVFNLITNANFSTAIFTGAASTFDLDDVVDIATSLKGTSGWDLDDLVASLVLNSNYYGALKKDNAVQDLSASGIDVVKTGIVGKIDQFALREAPTLPPSGGTPESENLTGFVARPEAIAIAMRAVESQDPGDLMWFEILKDPDSGVILVYRAWYDRAKGKVYHTFETLYGASVAYATALKRIVSA